MLHTLTAIVVVLCPLSLLAVLGLSTLFRTTLSETVVARLAQFSSAVGLVASLGMLSYMLLTNMHAVPLELGDWVTLENHAVGTSSIPSTTESSNADASVQGDRLRPDTDERESLHSDASEATEGHFRFRIKFVFDRLSVPFVIMTYVLCGVIGAFAFRYIHLELGYHRFFLFYSVFQLGMVLSSLAGTIETLFLGWELVGLSSALLIAFYHDRPGPVLNGLRVWSVYRLADAAFLIAALTLHHLSGSGDFEALMGSGDWPNGSAHISGSQAFLVGSLLLFAAAGKSALVPFSGWLPRAMEGPTPSSAVFYGALSVHLGAFLLLRVSPVLEMSPLLCCLVVCLGFVTMVFAAMAARVQTDVKSALSFASLTQVSIIVIEIGLGFRYLALMHIIGHACVRTLQLVRAPSLLKDHHALENALGVHLPERPTVISRWFSSATHGRLYRFSWERGYLDNLMDDYVVSPFVKLFSMADRIERRCTELLGGRKRRS